VQGRADPAARVVVLGAIEVGRALICLDRNRHFDPASIIKDQGPHACNEALLHEIDERRLRAALKTVQDRVAHEGIQPIPTSRIYSRGLTSSTSPFTGTASSARRVQ
jgi:cell division ATPase FtsA